MGAVFAERLKSSIRDLLKKVDFLRGDRNWIVILPTLTKQYNYRRHSSTKI